MKTRPSYWAIHPNVLPVIAATLRARTDPAAIRALRPAARDDEPDTSRGGVAVIPLKGILTAQPSILDQLFGLDSTPPVPAFREALAAAAANSDVKAILLDIDSPGGSTDLLPETAADVRQARQHKPVVALANTLAASAAYWIGSQADEFVITPSGQAGSIGVFAMHEDESGLLEQLGVDVSLISAGKYKVEGNPFEPLDDDARASMQDTVDKMYGMFTRDVAKGRSVNVDAVRAGFGEGRVLLAQDAVKHGLADSVATYEQTVAGMLKGDITSEPRSPSTSAATVAEDPGSTDNPAPNTQRVEEERARIGRLLGHQPKHVPH
jgi:signal peptide peptidase SppA